MELKINLRKNIHENAAAYFEEAKKYEKKIEGVKKAIKDTLKQIEKSPEIKKPERIEKKKTEWFEQFHYFFTSNNCLVISGRSAKQNEIIFSKYFNDEDIFFHADIHGASLTVLKCAKPTDSDILETAQFAACFSSAWKAGIGAINVYSAKKNQVSKYSQGEYVSKGGFVIKGERKWFKSVELKLQVYFKESLKIAPALMKTENSVKIKPGKIKRFDAMTKIKRILKVDLKGDFSGLLPGDCEIVQ
jgi:predicted ribosome quality control (RQC) complex YloA/Tae2 family protein